MAYFTLRSPSQTDAESITELQEKAEKLEQKISNAEKQASKYAQKANTLKEKIESLDADIEKANHQIKLTNIKIEKLEKELEIAQEELDSQKELLKANMRALYKIGGASTVELLVGSESFSEFIDEQEYLERLKASIQESTEKVLAIKVEIEDKRYKQIDLRNQQEAQREVVARAREEQKDLLRETQGQESRFRERSEKLQRRQARVLSQIVSRSQVLTGVGSSSYPWANFKKKKWTHAASCGYGNDHDPWGYCYRQCTSYAAWKLYSENKKPPLYYGDATNWGRRAKADGVPTGSKPKVGAIAVWPGYEGHVAYVEEIMSSGRVRISEFNAVPPLHGKYSQRIIYADDPQVYIYFK